MEWSSRVVPNNGNGGDTYRVTIAQGGPYLDIDATVDALTLEGNALLNVTSRSFASTVTRNDTSAFALSKDNIAVAGVTVGDSGRADLGLLANYDPSTKTLTGGAYSAEGDSDEGIISFKGANIVTNAASIGLYGPNGKLTDEFGNNALRVHAANCRHRFRRAVRSPLAA